MFSQLMRGWFRPYSLHSPSLSNVNISPVSVLSKTIFLSKVLLLALQNIVSTLLQPCTFIHAVSMLQPVHRHNDSPDPPKPTHLLEGNRLNMW